jgi:CspA family cold shock protein
MEKTLGTVKWFSRVKGYGFIQPDAEGDEEVDDVFVHYSAIAGRMVDGTFESMVDKFRNLKEGERVEFVIEDTPKGPQASDVVKL